MRKVIWPSAVVLRFVIGVLIGFVFSKYGFRNYRFTCEGLADDNTEVVNISIPNKTNLLLVGVMTADKFLETRAKAVYETWGQSLEGNIIFFSSEKSSSKTNIPLVKLANVDDSYPPRKKSLEMLKYMYKHYPHYEFYLRADDDLYVRTEMLKKYLSSVNSSKPLLIGQPGYGVKKERPTLHLSKNKPFCMGGPGIVISNKALQLFYHNIDNCGSLFKTTHEDVELWRCMNRYVGISCTKSAKMAKYFYNRKSLGVSLKVSIHKKDVENKLTLHPLKNHHQIYKLHLAFLTMQIQEKEYDIQHAMEEIRMLEQQYLLNDSGKAVSSGLGTEGKHFGGSEKSNIENIYYDEWNLFYNRTYYTTNHICEDNSYNNSSMKVAQEDLNSYLLNSQYRSQIELEFYARNLPGVATEFLFETRHIPGRRKHRKQISKAYVKSFLSNFSRHKNSKYLVKIPYGTLYVRENENHSHIETLLGSGLEQYSNLLFRNVIPSSL